MAGLNHKGPKGDGPMTGKKLGKCAPKENNAQSSDLSQEKAAGCGMGGGRKRLGLGKQNRKGKGQS